MEGRIGAFLLLSALSHGLLLPALWNTHPSPGTNHRVLQVSMLTARPAADSTPPDSSRAHQLESHKMQLDPPPKPRARSVTPLNAPATQALPVPAGTSASTPRPAFTKTSASDQARRAPAAPFVEARSDPRMHSRTAPDTEKHTPTETSLQVAQQQASAQIQQRLLHSFQYPSLARRKGWQGLVTLSIRVEVDGRLSHIRLLSSSGYGLLDRSALQAAARIRMLDRLSYSSAPLELVIPVQYRLLDS